MSARSRSVTCERSALWRGSPPVNFVASSLEAAYGSRAPAGVAIYLRLRPAGAREGGMNMDRMPGIHGGSHD